MRSAHVALTPLAGSPFQIVQALNRYTAVRARLVTLNVSAYGPRVFPVDIDWRTARDEARTVLSGADIIVLHHYFPLDENPFEVEFSEYLRRGTRIVRQFHTVPSTIAAHYGYTEREILFDPLPQLVVAQFHERYYPRARPVPLIVPLFDPAYTPAKPTPEGVRIFYGPTVSTPAWSSRWDTKGYPETCQLLRRVAAAHSNVRITICQDRPHAESLAARRQSHLVIDEMVTGGFHTSSLEALALGIPTFAYLDARTRRTIADMTGTSELPWLNFRLEEAELPLRALVEDEVLRKELGAYSREWMERHWRDDALAKHYAEVFRELLEQPERFDRPRFDPGDRVAMWFCRDMHDLKWASRKNVNDTRQAPVRIFTAIFERAVVASRRWLRQVRHAWRVSSRMLIRRSK